MSAYQQSLPSTGKRKASESNASDDEPFSRKRVSLSTTPECREGFSTKNAIAQTHPEQIWMVQWRNPQFKKHKTWDGDAILVISHNAEATLYDSDGKIMNTSKVTSPLYEGKNFSIGSREIELERTITRESFLFGTSFGRSAASCAFPEASTNLSKKSIKKFIPPSSAAGTKSDRLAQTINASTHSATGPDLEQVYARDNPISNSVTALSDITSHSSHWAANWRKPQDKKNKTWDGDAYVSLINEKLVMISEDGKVIGSTPWKGQNLQSGFNFFIGGKEVELDSAVSTDQLPTIHGLESKASETGTLPSDNFAPKETKKFISPGDFYGSMKQKVKKSLPMITHKALSFRLEDNSHDPNAPESLVMKAPTKEHIKRYNKKNLPVVDVVVDPIISRKLRPHQREGLKFLYECVMGLRKHEGQGCILADEMGLGKTLQVGSHLSPDIRNSYPRIKTIALVWTVLVCLLTGSLGQNPYAGPVSAVQKVLIVCPVSLVNNWKAEFYKWLGRDRLGIMTCDKNHADVDLFGRSKVYEVLVVGYERLRTVILVLPFTSPPIGLIICDEGHRLKSASNKTTTVFKSLDTRRRIILSGTPIQNDLGEFHAMADFCNPGLLDDYNIFRKVYETPILKSRAPDATKKEIELGEARTTQLLTVAKSFVLRRDATLLKNHLPPKSEYVVFIAPTALQVAMYQKILHPQKIDDLVQSSVADSLALINILIKISNSPILLKATLDSTRSRNDDAAPSIQKTAVAEALSLLPDKANITDLSLGGKLIFLSNILKVLRQNTSEKCVLVSHYTSTLNILEAYCKKMSYSYYRLDGQTPQNKRQDYFLVKFESRRIKIIHHRFGLESKASASNMSNNLCRPAFAVMISKLWHDATGDDGQKKPVYIYRMLTTGAIDEKIYQRQVTKLALSDCECFVGLMRDGASSSKSDSFTRKDLRDIFRIYPSTACNTHELLECGCDLDTPREEANSTTAEGSEDAPVNLGFVPASDVCTEEFDAIEKAKKKAGLAALGEWDHINCLKPSKDTNVHIHDDILRRIVTSSPETLSVHTGREKERTRLETLLERVDIDNIRAMDGAGLSRDLPGGTISFLFEKCSKTDLYDVVNDGEE
ncbi:LOW QUALITY PROTEIN: hypothetical protein CVT25_012242 [Psilocybe cyanescens]|uniref:Helicase ATP-binding domain-containing protein n=1 Tax=Psilocybe cyanescens TaxID=93625 RepID=A0A409XFQ2_PSICY|nr:LOW QUALITY PROTEIN: hypothetical protein CVT25_012242 [Psilocybe cyanescens]